MKQLLKGLLILLVSMGTGKLYAQLQGQSLIDSLFKELPKQKDDTNKVILLNKLSWPYYAINPDEGIKYGLLALELATKLEWKKGIANADNSIGVNYLYKSDYPQALSYYKSGLAIAEEVGDKKVIASITGNIGSIYFAQGDQPKALDYYFRQLTADEEIGNKLGMATVTGNIGGVYYDQKNYSKAMEYGFKALKIHEESRDKQGAARACGNISSIYDAQGDFSNALAYDFKALKTAEEIGDKDEIAVITGSIGNTYVKQKNYTMAILYEQKALKMDEEKGYKEGEAWALKDLGFAYLSLAGDGPAGGSTKVINKDGADGRFKPDSSIPPGKAALLNRAIYYLQRSLLIGKEINAPRLLIGCFEDLTEAYRQNGDYKKALECADNGRAIKDSVFSKENNEQIVKLGIKNDFDRQHLADSLKTAEKEKISALQLRRQRSYTILGIAGILLLAGFSFFIVKERGKSEQERKKSDDLLLNILPGEVANELKATGTTTARHFDNVTVLFTDFVNFTQAGERMSPQSLIDELHACFKKFDEITGKYNIEKIKTIGDAYLAVAGLPSADAKHAEHIVQAAIEINAFMQDRVAKLGERTFQIRIGVHSGSVVAGIVGVKKFAYDIWGDTVNTAARMEQNSEAGRINISETTYELVKDKFSCEYRGEIEAKGKGMLKMYFIPPPSSR